MRSAEGPAASNFALEGGVGLLVESAEEFSDALAFAVDTRREECVGSAGEGFGDVGEARGLRSIDGAGAGEEELCGAVAGGELKNALGSGDDCGEHFQRGASGLGGAGLCGGVDDEWEFAGGKGEGADVAFEEGDGGIGGDVGRFLGEAAGIAGEDGEAGVEAEEAVDMAEARQARSRRNRYHR